MLETIRQTKPNTIYTYIYITIQILDSFIKPKGKFSKCIIQKVIMNYQPAHQKNARNVKKWILNSLSHQDFYQMISFARANSDGPYSTLWKQPLSLKTTPLLSHHDSTKTEKQQDIHSFPHQNPTIIITQIVILLRLYSKLKRIFQSDELCKQTPEEPKVHNLTV